METQLQLPPRKPFGPLASRLRLARWLGPWADESVAPPVASSHESIPPTSEDERPIKLWIYRPLHHAPRGSYLLLQGVHYQGPEDPRMDRFARVLAYAGFAVFAPCVPDYINLHIQPEAFADGRRILQHVLEHPLQRYEQVSLFSISFGSLLGFSLASDPAFRNKLKQFVVFGGYIDWEVTIRFCVTGEVDGKRLGSHDPLNLPVLFIHVFEALDPDVVPDDPSTLLQAWRTYIQTTWGRPEMKAKERFHEVARRIADEAFPEAPQEASAAQEDPRARELFLIGCGLVPGALALIDDGLARGDFGYLDPIPFLGEVHCPVEIIHGADDDVIPWTEASKLHDTLAPHTPVQTWLTGLYGHTGSDTPSLWQNIPAAIRELRTMLGMLRAMTR